ncbi:MAG: protein kinase family protein with domain [Actinomycetia bacterium]|nr:protein kinase family protein with domain [Actinomycetes bacterium]
MAGSGVADLAGRVLADRYRLHAPIGTGASGRVYVAQDSRLNRRVALKVLHAALADDSAFLRRFRSEAQLAASLNHPHIVTVYDWGEDEVPFLVLELLEGGSLRAMLDAGQRLTPSQATRVGRDVASALEYAHARGIVHRDIKPANLLFDEHGVVRVADFGLARALAEASWTEPAGAMFGTARYASPEQAMGVQLDPRSDLYSLALVTVEAITGRVPFAADTAIGTLAARTQRALMAPPELGPLAPIIERAGQIEPEERYPDAITMGAALADVAEALPRPAPLVLAGMQDHADPHPTTAQTRPSALLFDQDASDKTQVAPAPAPPPRGPRRPKESDPRRLVPFFVGLAIALVLALVAVALGHVGGKPVPVPGLVGRSEASAFAVAKTAGISTKVIAQRSSEDPAGTVIDQQPAAGGWLHGGGTVALTVSTGPAPVSMPGVVGTSAFAAAKTLTQAGFLVQPVKLQYNATVPKGAVISQLPAAHATVPAESKVTLTVSNGPPPVPVPDVHGLAFNAARDQLVAAKFQVQQVKEFSDTVPKDEVIRTDPPALQKADFGSAVKVFVSKGQDLVKVPDVTGLTVEEASTRLGNLGFAVNPMHYKPGRDVKRQDPQPGVKIKRGSTITLFL